MSVEILNYFLNNLWFDYLEFKNAYAIYGTKIHSMFQKDNKYIFVFVDTTKVSRQVSLGRERLADLPWVSIQTRLIPKDSDTYSQRLVLQELKFNAREVDGKLRIQNRSAEKSVYFSEDRELQVELLHNPSNSSIYQFNNNIMISTAIELFQSVFVKTGRRSGN